MKMRTKPRVAREQDSPTLYQVTKEWRCFTRMSWQLVK
jgi:hypothetical protein